MLLCIDIGNTDIVLGVVSDGKILNHWRIRTEKNFTPDELEILVGNLFDTAGTVKSSVEHIIISSVVPPLLKIFELFSERYFNTKPLFVGPDTDIGMPNLYRDPKEVGADRLVNAVGAYNKYRCALVIVDLGTATTFDYVSQEGSYMGGAIAPGIMISTEALIQKTSKLPRIDVFTPPTTAIARDTLESMNVGIIYGYAGLVDGIVKRMKKESREDVMVIATGGLAPLIADISETIERIEEFLTLEGLIAIFEKNAKAKLDGFT